MIRHARSVFAAAVAAALLASATPARAEQKSMASEAGLGLASAFLSLLYAPLKVVYALGAQDQLVGTDTTSLFPAAALRTPKVGYMRQLSAEGVLSLRPDALVATTEAGPPVVLDQLRGAGVKLELIRADHSWNEVQRKVQAVGRPVRDA